jgi:lipid II:glycine glycyltransferase (peptidoglycan interpeptide bridge formation enzyme)
MEDLLDIYTKLENNLLQSNKWANFYESLGRKTWFISCDEDKCLVIKLALYKDKFYLYVPRGPQCSTRGWHVFLKKVKELAKQENCVFIRVEPYKVPNGTLKKLGFRKVNKYSPLSRQFSPMDTLLLDLRNDESAILSGMKPKGRYNIRLAERKGIKVRESQKEEDLKVFYELSVGMKERGFTSFDFEHYEKLLKSLSKSKNIKLFVAEYGKEILSILMVCFFGKTAIYLHGASGDNKREFMPNHLAQWAAIKEAKKRGCEVYDFWGIAPNDDPNHLWAGITRFKKSFGGEPVHFLGAFDFTFEPFWYRMFSSINIVRKGLLRK